MSNTPREGLIEVPSAQLESLLRLNNQMEADLRHVVKVFKRISDATGNIGGGNMLMKLPGIIKRIQADPETFNFMDADIVRILEEYKPLI